MTTEVSLLTEDGSVPYTLMVGQIKIAVHAEHLHRQVETRLVQSLRDSVEGKFVQGSYIRRNSTAILRRSPLVHCQGDPRGTFVCTVDYVADRVALHPGDRITCSIDAVNKLSAMGRGGDYKEVKVYLPRDQYNNAAFFERPQMGIGATVWVEVMPSPEGAMHDPYVIVYGKIVSLRGDAVLREPEAMPTALRRVAPDILLPSGGAALGTLGEVAPSLSVVTLAYSAPSWENVLKGLLQRGANMGDLARGRTLTSPFADVAPLADPRFWWELVQRTPVLKEERALSCTVLAGDASEGIMGHVRMAISTLAGPTVRLPGEFQILEVDHPQRTSTTTAVVAVDPGALDTAAPTLTSMVSSEAAWVQRLWTGLAALEPSGTLLAVMLPRPTRMMADWMAWIGSFFREVSWLRPVAMDPLQPLVVVAFDGFNGMSDKVRKTLGDSLHTWREHLAAGNFVAHLDPSPASADFVDQWSQFLERAQRLQVRAARDALRVWEDQPDELEEEEYRKKLQRARDEWASVFRYPADVF